MIALLLGAVILLLLPLGAAGAAQASTAATLTASASSVPSGGVITFTYTVPSSEVSPYTVVAIIPGDMPQVAGNVTAFDSAPDASGKVQFVVSSVGGTGTYYAYVGNEETDAIYAGPVSFTVTKGTANQAPAYDASIGQGVLDGPYGVAVGSGGDVWASDTGHNTIAEFTPGGSLVREIGRGRLDHPEGIAIASSGDIWVVDTGSDSVSEFSPDGMLLASFGTEGSGDGELDQPDAVAVSGSTIYVADFGNSRIEEFTASGAYKASISVPTPTGVALTTSGDIWVSSASYLPGDGFYEYSPSGALLFSAEPTGSAYGASGDVGGIAVGAGGMVYVAQPDYGLVSVYSADGTFETEFGLDSSGSAAAEDLEFPQAVAVAPDGKVWVADSGRDRLTEFGPATTAIGAAAVPSGARGNGGNGRTRWIIALFALAAALLLTAGIWLFAARRRRGAVPAGAPAPAAPAPAPEPIAVASAAVSRRTLLAGATALSGVAAAGVLPASLRKAIAATPSGLRGSLSDIKHIVILMQENRSFDHYFGTMPGVRGFQDPTAIKLSTGRSVFYQPDSSHADGYLTPFHYNTKTTAAQMAPSLDHGWATQHQAWDNGKMDQWVPAKGEYTMGYFMEDDIPFHWALAKAFTLCDNYHCSILGPTNPNRCYMWTGMIDPGGTGGGPEISDAVGPFTWSTYPERLQAADISWQVYQEEDNYGDNALEWFQVYLDAPRSSPLWQRGMQMRPAGWFEADARAGRLPQVSWLVAPSAQSEHPDYMPAAGAEYIAQKLDAIASNEDLWRTTLFILTYDENDGYFDHVVPPTPPAGTPGEWITVDGVSAPIGLGYRVPCTLISPWTAGGNLYSGVLDHTSLIRIIEARFGVTEPNISAWRRKTCGDFTQALRFSGQSAGWPRQNQAISLAAASADLLTAQAEVFNNPRPTVPAVNEPVPRQ